jgi:hypothetical protein
VWPNDLDIVASAEEFLKVAPNHYLFVSSVDAYDHKPFAKPDMITEDAPAQPWNEPGRQYNRNKAESERRLENYRRAAHDRPIPLDANKREVRVIAPTCSKDKKKLIFKSGLRGWSQSPSMLAINLGPSRLRASWRGAAKARHLR